MGKKKEVTLIDISRVTGFSITTISHVINRTRHVESEKRKIILKAVKDLGYPTKKKNVFSASRYLGLIIADIRVDFFCEIAKEIEEISRNQGYNIIFCDSEESEKTETECINMLLERDVAGLIIAPCNIKSDYTYLKEKHQIPVVLIDRNFDKSFFDFVGIDNFKSSYQATKRFIHSSKKKISFIGYLDNNYTVRERKLGYIAAMNEENMLDKNLILQVAHKLNGTKDDIYEFLKSKPEIEAILCMTPNICFETLWTLSELGIDRDIGPQIISYADNMWFDQLKYPVTSIKQPTTEIAAEATELLFNKIKKPDAAGRPKRILLEHEFVDR